jgi:hypothetical protein
MRVRGALAHDARAVPNYDAAHLTKPAVAKRRLQEP